MSQSDVQIEHDSMDLDPQSLFSQFSPTLFFDQPVCTKDDWYILAEQTVPVTIDAFWKTIVKQKIDQSKFHTLKPYLLSHSHPFRF